MIDFQEKALVDLMDKNLISEQQNLEIQKYKSLKIFSLHNELRFLLYLSILLFTSGIGILIYKNIDTIGHSIILGLIFIVTVLSYYFCYKQSTGFQYEEIFFKNPVFDYLVLLGTILSCTFVGYLQFQYHVFGTTFGISALVGSTIAFASAYYFDNKSALSIAITGLATSIGIQITPQTLIKNEIYSNTNLIFSGLILGSILILWTMYSDKIKLKKHFKLVFLTFALHLCSICIIAGLLTKFNDVMFSIWFVFVPILCGSVYYFNKVSSEISSVSLFVFNLIYGYIGINILFAIVGSYIHNWDEVWILLVFLFPVYFVASIVLFIKGIKNFNKS